MWRLSTVWLMLVMWVGSVHLKEEGPPVGPTYPDLCTTMMPEHDGLSASSDPSMFEVVYGASCYKANVDIPVMVRVTCDSKNEKIEGVFVQAKMTSNQPSNYGTFSVTEPKLQTLRCFSTDDSAVGHHYEPETKNVSMTWTPPASGTDELVFVATVVRRKSTFWVGLESDKLPPCGPNDDPGISDITAAECNGAISPVISFSLFAAAIVLTISMRP